MEGAVGLYKLVEPHKPDTPLPSQMQAMVGRWEMEAPFNAINVPLSTNLAWSAASGAASYRIQLATDSLFGSVLIDDSTLTSPVKVIGSLVNHTRYYWRVRSQSVEGKSPTWSQTWSFTTVGSLPSQSQLALPASGGTVTRDSVILTWHPGTPSITGYHLEISTDSTFSNGTLTFSPTDTSQTVKPLLDGARYYWRVRSQNAAGSAPYSQTANFNVLIPVALLPKAFFLQNLGSAGDGVLRFGLAQRARVTAKLFDSRGSLAKTLIDEVREGGHYTLRPKGLSRGSYVLEFKADGFRKTMMFRNP